MLTKTQKKIIASLLNNPLGEQFSIRGIAKKLGLSYTLTYNNIASLEKQTIIRKIDVPPAQIIVVHDLAPQEILIDVELETRNIILKKHTWIKVMLDDIMSNVKNPFFTLMIFGSYAKRTQTQRSDIDLLVIVQNLEYVKEIENAVNKAYTKVKKSLIIVSVDEFKDMLFNNTALNVSNEARKSHIILHGVEQYYRLLKTVHKR